MKWLSRLLGIGLVAASFFYAVLELRLTRAAAPTSHLVLHGVLVLVGLAIAGYAQLLEDFIAKVAPFVKKGGA